MIFVKDSKEGEVVLSLLIDCLEILHLRHDHVMLELKMAILADRG